MGLTGYSDARPNEIWIAQPGTTCHLQVGLSIDPVEDGCMGREAIQAGEEDPLGASISPQPWTVEPPTEMLMGMGQGYVSAAGDVPGLVVSILTTMKAKIGLQGRLPSDMQLVVWLISGRDVLVQ